MVYAVVKLPPIENEDRVGFISRYARDRKVLHIGCADWPFTEEKLARGSLLHQRLAGCASELHGADTSEQGIRLMLSAGIENLCVLPEPGNRLYDALKETYDVVVAGEVIEHVSNPGRFLDSLHSVLGDDGLLILTTINFAPIKRLPRLLWRNEQVHPDHVFYFSFSTLTRLLTRSNWDPVEWRTYWRDVGAVSRWSNHVLRRLPFIQYYADGFSLACRSTLKKSIAA